MQPSQETGQHPSAMGSVLTFLSCKKSDGTDPWRGKSVNARANGVSSQLLSTAPAGLNSGRTAPPDRQSANARAPWGQFSLFVLFTKSDGTDPWRGKSVNARANGVSSHLLSTAPAGLNSDRTDPFAGNRSTPNRKVLPPPNRSTPIPPRPPPSLTSFPPVHSPICGQPVPPPHLPSPIRVHRRPFAVLPLPSTNGAHNPSLGYSPRNWDIETIQGLKARHHPAHPECVRHVGPSALRFRYYGRYPGR